MTKVTEAQLEKALLRNAGNYTATAKLVGVTRQAVQRRVNSSERLKIACALAKETTLDVAEGKLVQAISKGEPWAVKFFLDTQGKDRGYTTRHELQEFKPRAAIEAEPEADDWAAKYQTSKSSDRSEARKPH